MPNAAFPCLHFLLGQPTPCSAHLGHRPLGPALRPAHPDAAHEQTGHHESLPIVAAAQVHKVSVRPALCPRASSIACHPARTAGGALCRRPRGWHPGGSTAHQGTRSRVLRGRSGHIATRLCSTWVIQIGRVRRRGRLCLGRSVRRTLLRPCNRRDPCAGPHALGFGAQLRLRQRHPLLRLGVLTSVALTAWSHHRAVRRDWRGLWSTSCRGHSALSRHCVCTRFCLRNRTSFCGSSHRSSAFVKILCRRVCCWLCGRYGIRSCWLQVARAEAALA